jgi:AAA+ superfamily predicted ATPase
MPTKKITLLLLVALQILYATDESNPDAPNNFVFVSSDEADPNYGLKPEFMPFDPLGIAEDQARKYCEEQFAHTSKHTVDLKTLMIRHKTELPSLEIAEARISSALGQYQGLAGIVRCLQNESEYKRVSYPSRILFTGPSGCGKTELAKSIARICNMHCLFIKGSSVANTFQNSGSVFLDNLFQQLCAHPEEKFLVIFDEISCVSQLSNDGKDPQKDLTATAFWLGLDQIANKRHICIIGTDNQDPDKLSDQLKTRFSGKLFHFKHANVSTIVNMMEECLNFNPDSNRALSSNAPALHNCSDGFLKTMAQRVSHLSLREIKGFIEEAIELAIYDSQNSNGTVLEKHIRAVWNHHNLSW